MLYRQAKDYNSGKVSGIGLITLLRSEHSSQNFSRRIMKELKLKSPVIKKALLGTG